MGNSSDIKKGYKSALLIFILTDLAGGIIFGVIYLLTRNNWMLIPAIVFLLSAIAIPYVLSYFMKKIDSITENQNITKE
ncbi:MAG: hypothetical protein HW421_2586 [Ignavibacteria bacterium]|nr:hypothetical protein [Ignavibacteria bacterium]